MSTLILELVFSEGGQGFPNSGKGQGDDKFCGSGEGLLGGGNLTTRNNFDHSNLFQSLKQHSVNIEDGLKSKLA